MAEICEHFELRASKNSKSKTKSIKLGDNNVMTIKEASKKHNMTVTEFLEYIGKLEREGVAKINIV